MILLVIAGTLFVTFFVGAVLHEVAHALAAACMGLGVKEVQIGGGPVMFRTGLGRTPIEIRLIPGQGLVQHLRPVERWRRVRMFVFIAAGPACDVFLLIALIAASRQPHLTEYVHTALMIAVAAQGYSAFSNLWPRTVELNGLTVANDGLQLLRLLTNKSDGDRYQGIYAAVLEQYMTPGQSLPALAEGSAIISDYIVATYVNRERITPEMYDRMEASLSSDMPVCEQLLLLDALITATLPEGDPKRLADLDRWSAQAYALASGIATIRASRGAVLIEIGRPEEGLALLEGGLSGQDFNDCLVHAFRALGYFQLGHGYQAENAFARATALFDHAHWHGHDIARIVARIGKTIGSELKSPATWSVEAARAAIKTKTSVRPVRPDRP